MLNQDTVQPKSYLEKILEAARQRNPGIRHEHNKVGWLSGVVTPKMIHPATRKRGKSFTRREKMRRNRARYGKRQIRLDIGEVGFGIDRDFHMPQEHRKPTEYRDIETLEAYQHALYTSGYRLHRALGPNQSSLIYQYEGRLH